MISKKTLEAAKMGILTDDQLKEALDHYRTLTNLLQCHPDYIVIWRDAYYKLLELEGYERSRERNRSLT
jgi:hypothetical protein